MHPAFVTRGGAASIPIWFVTAATWRDIGAGLDQNACAFAKAAGFEPLPGRHALLPGPDGALAAVLFGLEEEGKPFNPFLPGTLAGLLPRGVYRFANAAHDQRLAALAVALGAYRFIRYGKPANEVRLEAPEQTDGADLSRIVEAVYLARDLINTPANDMGPGELAAPKVTLVGKGVCFDSGGLDIKSESAMLLMKKDMGGAAGVLALAHMIMDRRLDVRLRVLIPAVENSISGGAFRPLDIYKSRKGLQVEVGNTDAEGRLVLADALALADEERPDLLVDMGTLTGAARVALGPDLPPYYTDDEALAGDVARHARAAHDPLWRLPLWRPYDAMLDSKVADTNNIATGGFAGSIICALFLNRFVGAAKAWLHLDIYAWTPSPKPGRPEGGECQGARALYSLLAERYGG